MPSKTMGKCSRTEHKKMLKNQAPKDKMRMGLKKKRPMGAYTIKVK